MKFFKQIFASQILRLRNVKEGDEIYFVFLRVSQVLSVVTTLYALVLIAPMSIELSEIGAPGFTPKLFVPLIISFVVIFTACEIALRCLDKNKIVGFYLGLFIAMHYCFGIGIILGLFGFYSLLNPSAQKRFLKDAPPWLKEFLTFCRINHLAKEDTEIV